MQSDPNAPPINPLPAVVWLLVLPVIAMEVVLSLGARGLVGGPGAVGWRLQAIRDYGFSGQVFDWMLQSGQFPADQMIRFVTYPFVHASLTHAVFVVVFILALGKMVGEVFRAWAVLLVFFGAAIVGALAYGLLLDTPTPLIGGYPAVYGLIGAFTFLMWVRLAGTGPTQYRAFTLIGVLLGIQLLFGLLFGGGFDWVADLAGFCTGFVLSFVVSPGGWARVRAKIRQR
ncbi:rhomboid family intramembrane serine protease [Rhodovulum sulfidophilum]|uniref:rhomboid family intramembrane serine protease n=1 Tax=Rhodovulum sulfidophilum TaxID=35806 RepID=UPI0005A7896C|nr:rhomboid family intramembrane serine protease [Rhodovulum sulfidophilum]ANB35894.1 rhomboid family intramembrane serine protease [Rhodovulum sulfidophilum DSM 1374]ANB39705.1 rhomboid family intramembrane serine protease [Rhodovulum sulfidophilum]MBL3551067.1 rhomboid family intramembrane serine protease [Rhodovulum sulfidophilum]MBL3597453.1 rhomboid family intramembrane serine protease [Rhodovulum sulfidophilum]MCW2304963.1 membrane associated rhomboid family serine protease [Rhodovulum s